VLSITQLVVVSLLTGVARVFFDIGYQSYLPSVVPRDQVLAGNSSMEALRSSGEFVGPGLGGWLVSVVGAAQVVSVQAVTLLVSAASLLAIRSREPAPSPTSSGSGLRGQVVEGLRYVARNRVLRSTTASSALSNFAFAVASAVTFIFMARTLSLSATAIGLVLAAGSATVMVAAALIPRLSVRVGTARIIWLSLAVTGPFNLLIPLAQPGWSTGLVVVGAAAGNAGQIVYSVTNVSLRQQLCPSAVLSRVTATMRFLIIGVFPLGAVVGGLLGELIGARGALWVAGCLLTVAALPVYGALRAVHDVADLPRWADHRPGAEG
jgi:Na+/melibiose symporter-like transporter